MILRSHFLYFMLIVFSLSLGIDRLLWAEEPVKVNATVIIASNEGSNYDLVNDAFRDRLIELFSYSSYQQVNAEALLLSKSERVKMALPDGYELILTLQSEEQKRVMIQAVIKKEQIVYVDTILSVLNQGVAFLGGPPINKGETLIIVLENGF